MYGRLRGPSGKSKRALCRPDFATMSVLYGIVYIIAGKLLQSRGRSRGDPSELDLFGLTTNHIHQCWLLLALVRVVEPLFESVPQLLLQLYAMLTLWTETSLSHGRLAWRVGSVCISVASLAYAATDVSSVECLAKQTGEGNAGRICSFLTGWVFSRVPEEGNPSEMKVFGKVHPRSHVWFCLVYHVLEIVSRFVSLSMVFTVIRKWSLLVLLYLWMSRGVLVWASKTSLDFRFRVRLVAMPFLDSIVDRVVAFRRALVWTLLEFMLCLVLYHAYAHYDLSASARRTLTVIVCSCMVGKLWLAWVAIVPLKEIGQVTREVEGPVRC